MKNWLAGSWEPNWRSLSYFNLYRLVVALLLLGSLFLPITWNTLPGSFGRPFLEALIYSYLLVAGLGLFSSLSWRQRFNLQLTAQICLDVVVVSLIMYVLGGVSSGMGLLLMISLAAASLVGQGRLVLFYAAVAALAVLLLQFMGIWWRIFDPASIVQAGLLSGGFFATAVLGRLLGSRAMAQEELARRRGVALENQDRISRRILERMQDGVLIVDCGGKVVGRNPCATEMLGIPMADSIDLDSCAPRLVEAFRRWRQGGSGVVEFEGLQGGKLRARFEATNSSEGESLAFIEDVSRIRSQALQLKLASLGRLTASIAHEIRNPLAAISHASELLQEECQGGTHDRLLRILRDNVFRLDRIVQDILQLGRGSQTQPERLRLDEFLPAFVEDFCAVEQVAAGVVCFESKPLEMLFDRAQLLQVLWNLAGNALRHASGGPGSIRLEVAQGREGRVELHVIDDGPGIPEGFRDQIFEPFFTTRGQGLGLGLFIARELCEANGASLQLRHGESGHFVIVGGEEWQQAEASAGPKAN
ncbi:MAG: Sensor protein ZraS [Betaproteobacteria bacterium ADurb.Bin341]|nr:MAG: Sensor protein ZraS [Betaproteobacteria bacterium ADurb.Bin341]